jgi:hypothetical protein
MLFPPGKKRPLLRQSRIEADRGRSRALGGTRQSSRQSPFPICRLRRACRATVQSLIHPFLMDGRQVGFLKITESVEYFLPFVRSECGQKIQDFSFAHTQSLRQGTPKDKRSGRFPSRPAARFHCHLQSTRPRPSTNRGERPDMVGFMPRDTRVDRLLGERGARDSPFILHPSSHCRPAAERNGPADQVDCGAGADRHCQRGQVRAPSSCSEPRPALDRKRPRAMRPARIPIFGWTPATNGQGYSDSGELAGNHRPAVPPINTKVRPVHRPNLAGVGQLPHAHQASISEVYSRRYSQANQTAHRGIVRSALARVKRPNQVLRCELVADLFRVLLQVPINQRQEVPGPVTAQLRRPPIHPRELRGRQAQCHNVCHTSLYCTHPRPLARPPTRRQSTPAPSPQGLDTANPSGSATITTGPRRRWRSWVCEPWERGQEHQF